jgi:DNA mismatch repair protein PMS2
VETSQTDPFDNVCHTFEGMLGDCRSTCDDSVLLPKDGITAAGTGSVEDCLPRVLTRQRFDHMGNVIVGQFNNGFIVAGTGKDLFILDQHACDEKTKFEYLQAHTVIHEQRLLFPRPIDLTAGEQLVIREYMDVFNRNGFYFDDETGDEGQVRGLRLSAIPFSKNVQFGDEDVRELASLVSACADAGSSVVSSIRLPKARLMFASRACRSAVMIGDSLSRDRMRRIVQKMATLNQPWNCPHGRPTMRHLVDLAGITMTPEPAGPSSLAAAEPHGLNAAR